MRKINELQKSFDKKQKYWTKEQIKNWKGWLKFVLAYQKRNSK
jgi:hypothetical protein